jgi:hypothetical protein
MGNEVSGEDQYEISLVLDKERYNSLLEMCQKYKEQQHVELTPKEYILMLVDSAIHK